MEVKDIPIEEDPKEKTKTKKADGTKPVLLKTIQSTVKFSLITKKSYFIQVMLDCFNQQVVEEGKSAEMICQLKTMDNKAKATWFRLYQYFVNITAHLNLSCFCFWN